VIIVQEKCMFLSTV